MDLELRTVRDDEMDAFASAVATGFGMTSAPEDDEYPSQLLAADRALAVSDGARIVATAGAYSFRITVPGGRRIPVAAVTEVTVHPTHRRRGLLRRMMHEQLEDVARRNEPIAALTASEASIYERFGYGAATFTTRFELAAEHARLRAEPMVPGTVALIEDDAAELARDIYTRVAAQRVGEIERPDAWWPPIFRPRERGNRFFTALHRDAAGRPDAFVRYAIDQRWPDAIPGSTLRVIELQAATPDAELGMWAYLFGVDLVGTVTADDRPVDDPLRWAMPDPRRLRVRQIRDHLWVRVVDVVAALEARTYGTDDTLVMSVDDEFRPANSGSWLLETSASGGACSRTDRAADLVLPIADLGAMYLGGVRVSTLAAAGRVRELTPGAVTRADRMFVVHPSPWCTTHF